MDALAAADRDVLVPIMPKFDESEANRRVGLKTLEMEVVNAGLWIVRNTPWARDFFGSYADRCNSHDLAPPPLSMKMHGGSGLHEQYCFFRMMYGDANNPRTRGVSQHIAIMSTAMLSCVPGHISYLGLCNPWHLHFMGTWKDRYYVTYMALRWLKFGKRVGGRGYTLFDFSSFLRSKKGKYHPARNATTPIADEAQCSNYSASERFVCLLQETEGERRVRRWTPRRA